MGLFDKLRRKASEAGPAAPAPGPAVDTPERRDAERFATTVLTCILGDVVDLSVTGMRVSGKQPPPVPEGMLFEFELESPTDAVTVVGRLVRVAKRKPTGYDIGIEFQRLTPETRAAIESLARHGVIKNKRARVEQKLTARMDIPDLYAMLGISADAGDEQIQRGFRENARKFHPDVNKTEEAQKTFVDLLKAYEVLKDPEKRRAYDAARAGAQAA